MYIYVYIYIYTHITYIISRRSTDGLKRSASDAAAATSICPNCCITFIMIAIIIAMIITATQIIAIIITAMRIIAVDW